MILAAIGTLSSRVDTPVSAPVVDMPGTFVGATRITRATPISRERPAKAFSLGYSLPLTHTRRIDPSRIDVCYIHMPVKERLNVEFDQRILR